MLAMYQGKILAAMPECAPAQKRQTLCNIEVLYVTTRSKVLTQTAKIRHGTRAVEFALIRHLG